MAARIVSGSHIANLIVTNGNIITMTASASASTIVVSDGVIVAVGDQSLISEFRGASTRVIDCAGRTVTPGLIDAHSHPILGAQNTVGIDLGGIDDAGDLLRALRIEADRILKKRRDGWLRAWNLDYAAFEELPLNASSIETAVRGLPALLLFFDGHTALSSHRALELAGIDEHTHFADNSRLIRDTSGSLTGELREESAIQSVVRHAPALSPEEVRASTNSILARMASHGLTGVCIMDGDDATFAALRRLDADAEGLPLRVVTAFDHHPGDGDELISDRLATLATARGRRWRGGLVKLYADGVIDTGTGWLYEPDTRGEGTSGLWGEPENLLRTMLRYSRAGIQIATHAIGDKAIGATIDAYLACGVRSGNDAHHRIEHIECLTDTDLARLATAGITASLQPAHLQWRKADGSDEWASRLGAERARMAWRSADLLAAGVPLALGSDWPVAQFDPRIGMAWARLRREPGNEGAPTFEPTQRLTAVQALHGFTAGAARAQGDSDLGHIDAGFRADLTIWEADPLKVSADELICTPIAATLVDGRSTFAIPELQST